MGPCQGGCALGTVVTMVSWESSQRFIGCSLMRVTLFEPSAYVCITFPGSKAQTLCNLKCCHSRFLQVMQRLINTVSPIYPVMAAKTTISYPRVQPARRLTSAEPSSLPSEDLNLHTS